MSKASLIRLLTTSLELEPQVMPKSFLNHEGVKLPLDCEVLSAGSEYSLLVTLDSSAWTPHLFKQVFGEYHCVAVCSRLIPKFFKSQFNLTILPFNSIRSSIELGLNQLVAKHGDFLDKSEPERRREEPVIIILNTLADMSPFEQRVKFKRTSFKEAGRSITDFVLEDVNNNAKTAKILLMVEIKRDGLSPDGRMHLHEQMLAASHENCERLIGLHTDGKLMSLHIFNRAWKKKGLCGIAFTTDQKFIDALYSDEKCVEIGCEFNSMIDLLASLLLEDSIDLTQATDRTLFKMLQEARSIEVVSLIDMDVSSVLNESEQKRARFYVDEEKNTLAETGDINLLACRSDSILYI
ncbi:hypothetical protein HDU67_007291 [Dinochytrium kinnereticum]|nr:hypothetical protein HDU67_007291 [Dinochytrium kinnereticum]